MQKHIQIQILAYLLLALKRKLFKMIDFQSCNGIVICIFESQWYSKSNLTGAGKESGLDRNVAGLAILVPHPHVFSQKDLPPKVSFSFQ